jgi:hypothetical protein
MVFVNERYLKIMYNEKFIQNKFNRELHVYYQYGSSQSFQWGVDFLRHFQQYFSYIVTVSFIGGKKMVKTTDMSQFTDKLIT